MEAIDPTTAYLVTSLLKSVVEEGTGQGRTRCSGKPLAGKTGTTNNYVDAWFVGYAPSIVTGVWVGYDNSKASLGDKETGARAALPIWISVMARALADKPAEDFAAPDDVVFVKIDPESGLLAREGAADAITDVFRKGTEPTQYADVKTARRRASSTCSTRAVEDTSKKKRSQTRYRTSKAAEAESRLAENTIQNKIRA